VAVKINGTEIKKASLLEKAFFKIPVSLIPRILG
jgi:hypothetical protein